LRGHDLSYDVLLTREAVTNPKPDPEHLSTALAALESEAGRTVMVGDHPMDMIAGKALDVRTIGVLTGSSSEDELRKAGADFVLASVADLPACLAQMNDGIPPDRPGKGSP
jgi:phosphoglycolate phosphatase